MRASPRRARLFLNTLSRILIISSPLLPLSYVGIMSAAKDTLTRRIRLAAMSSPLAFSVNRLGRLEVLRTFSSAIASRLLHVMQIVPWTLLATATRPSTPLLRPSLVSPSSTRHTSAGVASPSFSSSEYDFQQHEHRPPPCLDVR